MGGKRSRKSLIYFKMENLWLIFLRLEMNNDELLLLLELRRSQLALSRTRNAVTKYNGELKVKIQEWDKFKYIGCPYPACV